eukprot:6205636-Pleurochrysis_carterae.AAC.3
MRIHDGNLPLERVGGQCSRSIYRAHHRKAKTEGHAQRFKYIGCGAQFLNDTCTAMQTQLQRCAESDGIPSRL